MFRQGQGFDPAFIQQLAQQLAARRAAGGGGAPAGAPGGAPTQGGAPMQVPPWLAGLRGGGIPQMPAMPQAPGGQMPAGGPQRFMPHWLAGGAGGGRPMPWQGQAPQGAPGPQGPNVAPPPGSPMTPPAVPAGNEDVERGRTRSPWQGRG